MTSIAEHPSAGAPQSPRDTPLDLRDITNWPDDALIYDRTRAQFLTAIEAEVYARGIDLVTRHQLVFRPVQEVVRGILFEGYNILSAPPKIGKTIIAHQLMLAVATGRNWLGQDITRGPVLFIALEDTLATIVERELRLMGDAAQDILADNSGFDVVVNPGESPVDRMLFVKEQLEKGRDGVPWSLVVIDTSPRFLGNGDRAQNAYERGLELLAPLDRLGLRHHVAILGIHHDRKGADGDDFDAVSGGLSLTGTAQSVLSLRRSRGTATGVLNVYPRAAEERKLAIEFVDGAWQLASNLAAEVAEQAAGCRREVLAHLITQPAGATLQELCAVPVLSEFSYHNIRQACQRLRDSDLVYHRVDRWYAHAATEVTAPTPRTPEPPPPARPPAPMPAPEFRRPAAPVSTPDPGECDRCGKTPCRINNAGARFCAACNPSIFPPAERTPSTDARAPYRRPAWAPEPLAHPITVWNKLVEHSFRLKKVQLVAHPYPRDENVPPPFRKRDRARGMMIHEGRHNWRNPDITEGAEIWTIDRNGGFLGALGSARVPIGRLRHHAGAGPKDIPNLAGAHQLDRWPDWHVTDLPHPGGAAPKGTDEIWVSTETIKVLQQRVATGELEKFTILQSWLGPSLRLEQLQVELRNARTAALEHGDTEFLEFLKPIYSLGIATTGESAHNTFLWRPDWNSIIRSLHHVNMFRAAVRAKAHGLTLAAVTNVDELHFAVDPLAQCHQACIAPEHTSPASFHHSSMLAHWKPKGETYRWQVKHARR